MDQSGVDFFSISPVMKLSSKYLRLSIVLYSPFSKPNVYRKYLMVGSCSFKKKIIVCPFIILNSVMEMLVYSIRKLSSFIQTLLCVLN